MHRPGDRAWVVSIAALTNIGIALIANGTVYFTAVLGYPVRIDTAYILSAVVVFIFGLVWYYGRRKDDE